MLTQLGKYYDQKHNAKDFVCCTVCISNGVQTIWTNDTSFTVDGTITVENNAIFPFQSTALVINEHVSPPILPGQSNTFTVSNIHSIAIGVFSPEPARSNVKVLFSLNYKN
jgi:hypothetical protein